MFNRYWRTYPWYFQMLQFIILMFVMFSFFVLALSPLILKISSVTSEEILSISEHSSRKVINTALLIQFLSTIGIFLLPALLFAYFSHPEPKRYLGLVAPGKPVQLFLAVIVILSAMPLIAALAEWLMRFDLSGSAKTMQERNDSMVKAFTSMKSPVQLAFSFLVVAILPGISEELFFRGLLMRFSAKRSRGIVFPLVMSALMFALIHTNVYGMLSIFIAGLLLGSFYYLTGSIWTSILAHICFNGFQVLLIFFAKDSDTASALENNHVPLPMVIGSTVLCIASFYLLWKNRTPLAPDWHADFTPEELIESE